jgi:hypothetical protein
LVLEALQLTLAPTLSRKLERGGNELFTSGEADAGEAENPFSRLREKVAA